MNDCYKLIRETISEIPAESDFLSVLQDLLCLRDVKLKSAFCRKIEECISHKNGCDPVSRHRKRFKIEIEVLIDRTDKLKQDDGRDSVKLSESPEGTLTTKQEFETKFKEIIKKRFIPPKLPSSECFIGSSISPSPLLLPTSSGSPASVPPPEIGGIRISSPPSKVLQPKEDILKSSLKHCHWKKISPKNMSENAFWVVHQEKLASEGIFETLSEKFSSKPLAKKENKVEHKIYFKKVKELKILDPKAVQNLLILLRSVKKMSAQDMKQYILHIDEEKLTDVILQHLIKTLPDQLERLEPFKDKFNELNEAERFVLTVGSIKGLVPRLKFMYFKMKFLELVQDINSDIEVATEACKEVKESKKFSFILQMILLIGNYMNAGSKYENAFGFELNYLTKLNFTKAADHKTTLLHCLVEIIENKYPDALNFAMELKHFDRAAMVSFKQILENLNYMKNSLNELETSLRSFSPHNKEDRFGDVMTGFLEGATKQYKSLEKKFAQMKIIYKDLSEYYAFNPKEYTSDEFFNDIKTFKDMFQGAYDDNLRARELEEKMHKAREAKEKAQKEKQRSAKVDISSEDQEAIMGRLIALKASKFSHHTRRKVSKTDAAEQRARLNRSQSRSRSNFLAQHNGSRKNVQMYSRSRNGEVSR